MSKADLSSLLAAIQTRNAARGVSKSVVARGLETAIADGLVVELRHDGSVWGYRPSEIFARAVSL